MAFAITTMHHSKTIKAETWSQSAGSATLHFRADSGESALHVPRHVAEATAASFNRAMQVTCDKSGSLAYVNDAGLWHISVDPAMGTVWTGQHDEATGDEDPNWMFVTGRSLEDLQDQIDAVTRKVLAELPRAAPDAGVAARAPVSSPGIPDTGCQDAFPNGRGQ